MWTFDVAYLVTAVIAVMIPWVYSPFMNLISRFFFSLHNFFLKKFVQISLIGGTIRKWQGGRSNEPRQRNFK